MKLTALALCGLVAIIAAAVLVAPALGTDPTGGDPLLGAVRAVSARYNSFQQAEKDGYSIAGEPCVSSPAGTMGIHASNEAPWRIRRSTRCTRGAPVRAERDKFERRRRVLPPGGRPGGHRSTKRQAALFGREFDGIMPEHWPGMGWHYDLHAWLWETNRQGLLIAWNPGMTARRRTRAAADRCPRRPLASPGVPALDQPARLQVVPRDRRDPARAGRGRGRRPERLREVERRRRDRLGRRLADAVRAAGGEARRRPLRGRRRPASRSAHCEVELLFDNEDGGLGRAAFTEVSITRRLHRGGEGQYLVNRAAVRRTDVLELLADVGLGGEMHSIIGQGRVERCSRRSPRTGARSSRRRPVSGSSSAAATGRS